MGSMVAISEDASRVDTESLLAVEAALTERYEKLAELMAKAVPPEAISAFLYWPDVIVTGEGLGRVYRSLEDMQPMFNAVVTEELSRDCSWTVTDPIVASGNLAVAFTQVTSRYGGGKPDANFCVLYVWENRGGDWKVVREQVCDGTMR